MSKIKIGWCEKSLVPIGRKVNLAGQFYERITDTVESDISATALAIECGGDAVVFCSCDLGGVGEKLVRSVRARLADTDVPLDKIIINAIHSHTAPAFSASSDLFGGVSTALLNRLMPDAKYESLVKYEGEDLIKGDEATEFLSSRIAEAIRGAWDSRAEGMYATGFGRAAVGMCRRVCYDDGTAKMWGDTFEANFTELEGGNDSGIELLFTYDTDKRLTGVIANVACPAQVLEHRSFISSDYFGKVKEELRKRYGDDIYLLGLVSPAGDQCPRDMIRWVEPETPINDPNIIRNDPPVRDADPSMFDLSGCIRIGRRIAAEIVWELEAVSEFISSTELVHRVERVDLPLRCATPSEYESAMAAIKEFRDSIGDGTINFKDSARMHVHAGTLSRYEIQKSRECVTVEMHFMRLGNLAFATNPFELFLDYGNRIRAKSPARQTFLIQLAAGSYGYLPTEKAEKNGHYSAYISSGVTGHDGGDMIVRKTLSEFSNLWNK